MKIIHYCVTSEGNFGQIDKVNTGYHGSVSMRISTTDNFIHVFGNNSLKLKFSCIT